MCQCGSFTRKFTFQFWSHIIFAWHKENQFRFLGPENLFRIRLLMPDFSTTIRDIIKIRITFQKCTVYHLSISDVIPEIVRNVGSAV